MLIDTHAHLLDEAFEQDREQLAAALPELGIDKVIEVVCCPADFQRGAELALRHPNLYLAFGIHPEYAQSYTDEDIISLIEYLSHPGCVALGEIGLDYHWAPETKEAQLALFRRQLDIAVQRDIPVSLHIRDAYGDCMEVLEGYRGRLRGVMHCFSGSAETAERCVRLGLYIAFGGALTFKNNRKAPSAAAVVPLDRLLIETDCPYMAPEPNRGRRCDPSMTLITCRRLADIKGVSPDEMARITSFNARTLFGI